MYTEFYKFDGAGNDFVVVDNRNHTFVDTPEVVARMCHRRFGIGADGLMTLDQSDPEVDFVMTYYNSDGLPATMCGNGGRCIAAFALMLGLGNHLRFRACDGMHEAHILAWDGQSGTVRLGMREVPTSEVHRIEQGWLIDTGSPHLVVSVADLEHYDVFSEGRKLRYNKQIAPKGVNVDFVEEMPDGRLAVRTYERGVEDETWACGTGVTACALVTGRHYLCTRGGDFEVQFNATDAAFADVWLTGPVAYNFKGIWTSSAR